MNHTVVPAPGAERAGRVSPAPGAERAGRVSPAPPAPEPEFSHAASPCGGLAVTTTADGLPIGMRIAQSQLSVSLDVVAARILALCALARGGSAHRRRLELEGRGTPREVLDALGLPDRAALVSLEEAVEHWCRGGVRA